MASHSSLLPGKSHGQRSLVGCSPWGCEESDTTERLHFTFYFHALEKEMATHSSVLAWRIPGTGKPGGLLSMGLHRVRHDWSDLAVAAAGNWVEYCYHSDFQRQYDNKIPKSKKIFECNSILPFVFKNLGWKVNYTLWISAILCQLLCT